MLNFKLPNQSEINSVFHSFNRRERIIFAVLAATLLISTLAILESINKSMMIDIPARGGAVSGGIFLAPPFF